MVRYKFSLKSNVTGTKAERYLNNLFRDGRKIDKRFKVAIEMMPPDRDAEGNYRVRGASLISSLARTANECHDLIPLLSRPEDGVSPYIVVSVLGELLSEYKYRPKEMDFEEHVDRRIREIKEELKGIDDLGEGFMSAAKTSSSVGGVLAEAKRMKFELDLLLAYFRAGKMKSLEKAKEALRDKVMEVEAEMLRTIQVEKPDIIIVLRHLRDAVIPGYENMTL